MDNKLMLMAQGKEPVPSNDRKVAKQGRAVYDEVRLKGLQADGAMALAAHLMEGLIDLDDHRQALSNGDPIKAAILMEIEATAIAQCKGTQRSLYGNRFGL